jgi:protein-tyrosine-phosphatase
MVCLGNICRSPLAEGILASKLPKDKFFVDSAGTGNYHIGKQPDQRSIMTAQKKTDWILPIKKRDNFRQKILMNLIISMSWIIQIMMM